MHPALARLHRTTHWMSSAIGLASLLFFATTGITLNHPEWFHANPSTTAYEIILPVAWREQFARQDAPDQLQMLSAEASARWGLGLPRNIDGGDTEWVLDYPRPGGVGTVALDVGSGALRYERVDDGLIALVNDLHKGRDAGLAWRIFIDVVALLCLLFALTGTVLLWLYAGRRRSTWPLLGFGAALPLLLFWVFVP